MVVVKLVDAESSMYLMDFFYWLILSGRIQGHEQYTGPVERHQGTAVRCSLDASRGRCMMSLARLRPGFIFRETLINSPSVHSHDIISS